jgi:hypothetical protein
MSESDRNTPAMTQRVAVDFAPLLPRGSDHQLQLLLEPQLLIAVGESGLERRDGRNGIASSALNRHPDLG